MIPLYSVNCVQDKDVIKFEYEVEIYVVIQEHLTILFDKNLYSLLKLFRDRFIIQYFEVSYS